MTDQLSLWRQIARSLDEDIANARPGDRLPSEAQLAARFGVNRHTVRRALAALAEAGTVHARRGAGVFVAARPTEYPLTRRTRFHEALSATGRVPGRRVLSVQSATASQVEAQVLALAPGEPVLRVEGVSLSDGQVIGHFRSAFAMARLPGLAQHIRLGKGVTESLAACGVADYTRAWTRLTACNADAILAGHLQLRPAEAVMRLESMNQDPAGQPLEYGITHFAGARVTLTVAPE
ncbi:MAG: phosphonate metabolism transcriptional regulator PhnF [Rhodobacter sp.]|uniref:phosphonate metabolism transcriptional regulator PhnF n=1 Tax=Pararhodobacter sp. TaxID=2127056 RepID=UPI001E01484E|nr:phosphonate metabolism transcriptional regulator PhnF [Pararhodobacter sp.]MCB1346147.1 phosphonate metabolism transcriptional regulator PhnF [Paracoccaceae bacterium]MCC0071838.1 phosphonate metabolism transcriptional regulator PhnF [Rhodobacter sp.]HPD91544.1 phosphonate metabolism transcriptional regulator PhnF [Pararhodobacter sp.]